MCSKPDNDSCKDCEVDNLWEKMQLAELVMDVKSVAGFLLILQISSWTEWRDNWTQPDCQLLFWNKLQCWILGFSPDKFLNDSRHFGCWSLVIGKIQCLLAIGGDKKNIGNPFENMGKNSARCILLGRTFYSTLYYNKWLARQQILRSLLLIIGSN